MKMKKTFIIAEAGVNHNGDFSIAKKLIIEAKKAGADAVKFQNFNADKLANINTPKVKYQKKNSDTKETHHEMLKSLELSQKDTKKLFDYCKLKKIEFISTPYDVDNAKFLYKLGVKRFKTASADLSDYFLHRYLSTTKREVIISTGMANMTEISKCLNFYKKRKNISLLHCVSNYPCKDESLNLNCLDEIKKKFKCRIGFSDHTEGNLASSIAIAKGANVIEKHFTLSKNLKGPDHKCSLNPKELKDFILTIRKTEIIMGKKIKKCQKEELEMKKVSVKSFIVNKNLKKNTKIKLSDLELQRPNVGFTGFELKKILGKKINKNKLNYTHLKKNDF